MKIDKEELILNKWKNCWGVNNMQTALLLEKEEQYLKCLPPKHPNQDELISVLKVLKNNDKYFHISDIFNVNLAEFTDDKYGIYNLQQNKIEKLNRIQCRPYPIIPLTTIKKIDEYSLSNTYADISFNTIKTNFRIRKANIKDNLTTYASFERPNYVDVNILYTLIENHILSFNKNNKTSIKSIILSPDMFKLLKGKIKKDFKINYKIYKQLHLNYVGSFNKDVSMYEYTKNINEIIFIANSKMKEFPEDKATRDCYKLSNIISNEVSLYINILRPFVFWPDCVNNKPEDILNIHTIQCVDIINEKNISRIVFREGEKIKC